MKNSVAAMRREVAPQTLDDPEERKQGESERAPVDERGRALVRKDGEEGPGDGDAARKVTFSAREGVCRRSCLKEEPVDAN